MPVVIAAAVLTYAATYCALKNFSAIESPRLAAVCVALLSGLSLLSLGNAIVILILLPCATLGLALLIFALFRWLVRIGAVRDLQRFLDDNTFFSAPALAGTAAVGDRRQETRLGTSS